VIETMREYLAKNRSVLDQAIDLTEFEDLQSL
jgi:hypothetical protein